MKKIKSMIALTLALVMGALLCGCSSVNGLSAPEGFGVDENNLLSWTSVRNARSYRIEIVGVESGERTEDTTRRTYYSLSGLAEGDYELRVMAIGGNQNESASGWSEVIHFHKDYESGLIYTLINNETEYMISKVGTAQGAVTIEDEYRGKPVTRIGEAAFRASGKLESVVIGKNVVSIGESAFYQCPKLVSVTIPEGVVSIGNSAFQGCSSLPQIAIPDSVTAISENMFAYCRALTDIDLGEGIETIGNSAFYACSALKSVTFPDSLKEIGSYAFSGSSDSQLASVAFGSGISQIGEYAFGGCGALAEVTFEETAQLTVGAYAFSNCDALASVELPEGLVSLSSYAFYGSDGLSDVALPDSVRSIGESVFNGTALYAEQAESEEYGGLIYADDWLVAVTAKAKRELPDVVDASKGVFKEGMVGLAARSFAGTQNVESISLPDSVKYIGAYAFSGSVKLYSFLTNTRSSNLEELGEGAFMDCEHLGNIHLNAKLKNIGAYAFYNCATVSNNELHPDYLVPDSVESIGRDAFFGTYLSSKPDDYGVIYAGNWVVGYSELTTSEVDLSSGTQGIADWAFSRCADLRSVSGLQRVTHIGYGAFAFCENLTYLSGLYRYLETIEPYTFYGCRALLTVSFPRELKEIGYAAFAKCEQLYEIDLSDTLVSTIDLCAFYGCFNVKEVLLGDSLETVGAYAFYALNQVTELTIPASVREIGERAFAWWESLETLTIEEGTETIGDFAFRCCTKLSRISIPDSVTAIGNYAFYNCGAVETLSIGNGVKQIGMCAFYGLRGIDSLELPAADYIGDYAFMGCSSLRSLTLKGEIGYIGAHAFYGCGLMTVYAAFAESGAEKWNVMWDSAYRPVVWESALSEEGYVVSVTAGNVSNIHSVSGFSAPARKGYRFLGWSSVPGGAAEFDANALRVVEPGTVLYAVWEEVPADGDLS